MMIKKFISKLVNKIFAKTLNADDNLSDEKYNVKEEIQIRLDELNENNPFFLVLPCKLDSEEDTRSIQNHLRGQNTVILLNIESQKDDVLELKRLFKPIKMTVDAVGGNIASLSEKWIVLTPNSISIDKTGLAKSEGRAI